MGAKLNLGGGERPIEGFLNVDLCEGADVKHDMREPLPFKDGEVEEIIAIHIIESWYQFQFPAILKDWVRVLQKGGRMMIEFTVLSETARWYVEGTDKQHGKWGLYGNQSYPQNPITFHHYVYEKDELENLLKEAGMGNFEYTYEGIAHCPGRDLRVICYKL